MRRSSWITESRVALYIAFLALFVSALSVPTLVDRWKAPRLTALIDSKWPDHGSRCRITLKNQGRSAATKLRIELCVLKTDSVTVSFADHWTIACGLGEPHHDVKRCYIQAPRLQSRDWLAIDVVRKLPSVRDTVSAEPRIVRVYNLDSIPGPYLRTIIYNEGPTIRDPLPMTGDEWLFWQIEVEGLFELYDWWS